jgi:predicted metal-dependent enzyme (double-stranded beta helix superfamily)
MRGDIMTSGAHTTDQILPGVHDLVGRVRHVVAQQQKQPDRATAAAVSGCLRPALRDPDLLSPDHQQGSPEGYRQHVLHVEPDGSFSIVALVWLPGQSTPVHDHVSWCTVGVYRGEETEFRYRLAGDGADRRLVVTERLTNELGSVSGIAPPGDIHQVVNTGSGVAISLHVYGADIGTLGSSIRRCYDLPGKAY